MALNIKDPETDRLVRELAQLTGESITTAVKEAVQARIDWAMSRDVAVQYDRRARIQEIIDRGRGRPLLNHLTEDEILGYDQSGLPA
jgi:antitoxin VapB